MSSKEDKKYKLEQWQHALRQEIARLDALPLADLAAEVMIRGFGPGGPGADDDAISLVAPRSLGHPNDGAGPDASHISFRFVPFRGFALSLPAPPAEELKLRDQLIKLISEGLQLLEHALLVRCQICTDRGHYLSWVATRYGRAALQRGDVQAILHRHCQVMNPAG